MAGIEELRAKAMASMAAPSSTRLNPRRIPTPPPQRPSNSPQGREDGETLSSSPFEGAKEIFACNASTSASAAPTKHSPANLTNKQHEYLKRGSSLGPNQLPKLGAAKKMSKKNYSTQIKQAPFRSRTLTWHATSGSDDNLVISFSDDDTESETDDLEAEEKRQKTDHMILAERFKRPVTTSGQPTEDLPRFSSDKRGMAFNSVPASHQSISSIRNPQLTNPKISSVSVLSNKVQLQKHHPGTNVFIQQDQENIGDVLEDNKRHKSCGEIRPQETDLSHRKKVNHRKRKIAGINGNACDSEGTTHDTHLKTTNDKRMTKHLKADEESHVKNKSTPEEPVKMPVAFRNSDSSNCNETSSKHCRKEGFVGQAGPLVDIWKDKTNKTIQSSTTDFYGVSDVKSSIPFRGGVVDMQNVRLPCWQENLDQISAGISFRNDMFGQRVTEVSSSGLNNSPQLQKKMSSSEDTVAWCKIPSDNLELVPDGNYVSHTKLSSLPHQVDMDVESMLKMEELLDKELERAQELRHNRELEERHALQAYRKAQRALMDANSKCSRLYGKREFISSKIRAHMMQPANSSWCTSQSNKGESVLNLFEDLVVADNNLLSSLRSQMVNDKHNLELVGHESSVGATNADASSPPCLHVGGHVLMSDTHPKPVSNSQDGATPLHHNAPASIDHQKYPLTNTSDQLGFTCDGIRESMVTFDVESERGRENIQNYELEAVLRSKLVARLGPKGALESIKENKEASYDASKVDLTDSNKIQTIDMHNQMKHSSFNQLLNEAANKSSGIEKVNESVDEQTKDNMISAYAESPSTADSRKGGTSRIPFCLLPCSVLRVVSKHAKFILPETSISSGTALDIDSYDSMGFEDNIAEYRSILSRLMNMDSYMGYLAINPFWSFCMFELRGKCNDEECSWQHFRQQNHRNGEHNYNTSVSAYWIGSNLVKAENQSCGSLLARSNWQFRQTSFCMHFCLPFPIERFLPADAPVIHDWRCHVDDDNNSGILSLYLHDQDSKVKDVFHGFTEPEQSLELAIDLLNVENKMLGRKKSLFVLSRSLEENPNNIVLWVVYLQIYYRKEKDVGKDDIFHHAVQHNKGSYELWLMYINSRMQFDERTNAYIDAISALSCGECAEKMDGDYYSSCILDLFLQMVDFLCMSGKVENAISIIHGFLIPTIHENSYLCPVPEIFQHLIVSDRCIFCICCIYVTLYRKLPDLVVQQHEITKDLPFEIEWPFIPLTNSEKCQALELMRTVIEKVDMDTAAVSSRQECFQQTILRSAHFMAVSHVRFSMAVEGLDDTADLLAKYLSEYPTCFELVTLSAHFWKLLKNELTFEVFEQALHNWPKLVPGLQCFWNQYAEYVLSCKLFDVANDLLVRWFGRFCKGHGMHLKEGRKDSFSTIGELPFLSLETDGCQPDSEDCTFGMLNLFLYFVLQKDMVRAQLAINQALKHAPSDHFKHCVREHVAFLFPNGVISTHSVGSLCLVSSYIGDLRSSPIVQPLNREIFRSIKKPRVRQLINHILSSPSRDCSLLNSILEDWYGKSLLPEEFDEPKDLVDCAEYLMEVSPANYRLAISVHKAAVRKFGQSGISSSSILFWASSLLVNCIFQTLPVAPQQAWVEAATLLNLPVIQDISEIFHRQALLVYPFSVKLWESYYNLSKITGSTSLVVESAREKGIEVG